MSIETMTKLATVTVGAGGSASMDFQNIPQTYSDLTLVISARSERDVGGSDGIRLEVNGSSSNLTYRYLETNGVNVADQGSGSTGYFANMTQNGGTQGWTANTFGSYSIYIPDYTGSKNKTFSMESVTENNASTSYCSISSVIWSQPDAITRLTIKLTSNYEFTEYSTATLYGIRNMRRAAGNSVKATGGNISFDGTYVVHTFNTSGTFTPTAELTDVDYLVVAGGGGGGAGDNGEGGAGGGGGAGGLRSTVTATGGGGSLESALSLPVGNYTITIGAGGAGGVQTGINGNKGTDGSNSIFSSITSIGGGGGGTTSTSGQTGRSGGSGGGCGRGNFSGGAGTAGQGYAGGSVTGFVPNSTTGGGGGGAGGAGNNGGTAGNGNGGVGVSVAISGSSVTYAGGGGAGIDQNGFGTPGSGGSGIGGVGASSGAAGTGVTNTGSGGGGGTYRGGGIAGGNGGSGIVIIRYKA